MLKYNNPEIEATTLLTILIFNRNENENYFDSQIDFHEINIKLN